LLNELVRQIQNLRKTSGLQMGQLATIKYATNSTEIKDVFDRNKDSIMKSVSVTDITFVEGLNEKSIKVGDEDVMILIEA
jgi:valyl-tRNA synthetase